MPRPLDSDRRGPEIRPSDLKSWHERWCPACLPWVGESECQCGGAAAHHEQEQHRLVPKVPYL